MALLSLKFLKSTYHLSGFFKFIGFILLKGRLVVILTVIEFGFSFGAGIIETEVISPEAAGGAIACEDMN